MSGSDAPEVAFLNEPCEVRVWKAKPDAWLPRVSSSLSKALDSLRTLIRDLVDNEKPAIPHIGRLLSASRASLIVVLNGGVCPAHGDKSTSWNGGLSSRGLIGVLQNKEKKRITRLPAGFRFCRWGSAGSNTSEADSRTD